MIFVESRRVTARLKEFLGADAYREFQNALMASPTKGRVIPSCGGLRKIRVEDQRRGKGKRGGARVVYLHIPEAFRIDLLAIYGKDEQDDLSAEQRKVLASMARQAKAEALTAARKGGMKP
jgi:mRNA-degrading endonuclease RelE of RelBE toxin-antitoxin system